MPEEQKRLPALKYLMNVLGFKTSEYSALSDKDKQELKQYAEDEQTALGIA